MLMQQYTALPAVVTLPLAALYLAFHDSNRSNNASGSPERNIGIEGELTEIIIPDVRGLTINAFDGLIWIRKENISTAASELYSNFLEDTPGYCLSFFNHILCFLVFQMIMKHSILGILTKIMCKHLNESLMYCYGSIVYLKDTWDTYKSGGLNQDKTDESKVEDKEMESAESDEFLDCTKSSTTFKKKATRNNESELNMNTNTNGEEKLSDEKHVGCSLSYIDEKDKGYESFVQSMHVHVEDSEIIPRVVRNSTPREAADDVSTPLTVMGTIPAEKFKRFLHQGNEMVEKIEVKMVDDDDDGYIVDNESGDESLCGTRSIIF